MATSMSGRYNHTQLGSIHYGYFSNDTTLSTDRGFSMIGNHDVANQIDCGIRGYSYTHSGTNAHFRAVALANALARAASDALRRMELTMSVRSGLGLTALPAYPSSGTIYDRTWGFRMLTGEVGDQRLLTSNIAQGESPSNTNIGYARAYVNTFTTRRPTNTSLTPNQPWCVPRYNGKVLPAILGYAIRQEGTADPNGVCRAHVVMTRR